MFVIGVRKSSNGMSNFTFPSFAKTPKNAFLKLEHLKLFKTQFI